MTAASLYTAMAGLQQITAQMQANAANLANAQTPGYAAIQAAAVAAPYEGGNAPPGADVVAIAPGPNTVAGPATHTGDPMDVALHGDAWLEVQTANGNALTRNGSLQITSAGILADGSGNPILSTGGAPISVPPLASMQIAPDGTISGVPASTPGAPAQNFGQINLVATPAAGLTDLGNSLFAPAAGATLQPASNASLVQNYINGSDVDATQTMVSLISDSRSYQLQTQLMKTQMGGSDNLNSLLAQG